MQLIENRKFFDQYELYKINNIRIQNIYKITNLFQKERFESSIEAFKEDLYFDHEQCLEYLFYFPTNGSSEELNSIIYDDFCTNKELAPFPILFNTISGGDLNRIHNEFLSFKERKMSPFLSKMGQDFKDKFLISKSQFLICKVFIVKSRDDWVEFQPYMS